MKIIFWLGLLLVHLSLQAQTVINVVHCQNISKTNKLVLLREIPFELHTALPDEQKSIDLYKNRIMGLGLFTWVDLWISQDTLHIIGKEKLYVWGIPTWSIAQPNINQWASQGDFINTTALGAEVYFKNIRGLHNQLQVGGEIGFNKKLKVIYEQKPLRTMRSAAFLATAEVKQITKYASDIQNAKLQWSANQKALVDAGVEMGVIYRHNLFNYLKATAATRLIKSADTAEKIYFKQTNTPVYYYNLKLEYIFDSRVQKHFPLGGNLVKVAINGGVANVNKTTKPIAQIEAKWNGYWPLSSRALINTSLIGLWQNRSLPICIGNAIGFKSLALRGYEKYVLVGNSMGLQKLAINYAVINNRSYNLSQKKWMKNYGKVPISVWCSIFAENARIVSGANYTATWVHGNIYSAGVSISALAYYNSMMRIDLARNMLKENVFNVSFTNAF